MRRSTARGPVSTLAALLLVGLVADCAAPPPPKPVPAPVPPPTPAPPPAPPSATTDWRDIALTPGDWSYTQENGAVFAISGGGAAFTLRCNHATRRVELTRLAGGGSQLRIRTSSTARSLAGTPTGSGVAASLPATDPLLDAIAFSRGRFSVENDSGAMLVLPAWPETARVMEVCRG